MWAWNIDSDEHDNDAKIYQEFFNWMRTVEDTTLIKSIPDLMLNETGISIVWRILFEIGADKPNELGTILWSAATDKACILYLDTRQSAIKFIAAAYSHVKREVLEATEAKWLNIDFSSFEHSDDAKATVLGTLFEAIGEENLVTDEAQIFLKSIKTQEPKFQNKKPFEIHTVTGTDVPWPDDEDAIADSPTIKSILELSSQVKSISDIFKANKPEKNPDEFWSLIWLLHLALDDGNRNGSLNVEIDAKVSDILSEALGLAFINNVIPADLFNAALERLMQLTHHSNPIVSSNTENDFARFQMWGHPSPRIQSARALSLMATVPTLWPQIQSRFEELLFTDAHPAVRYHLLPTISRLYDFDAPSMWKLIERLILDETNAANVRVVAKILSVFVQTETARSEKLLIQLSKRISNVEKRDDAVVRLLIFLAIHKGLPDSSSIVFDWIENFTTEEKRLSAALFYLRGAMSIGFDDDEDERSQAAEIRRRTFYFLETLISKLEPFIRSWPQSHRQPTLEEVSALNLFSEIAMQIFYSIAYNAPPELIQPEAKDKWLKTSDCLKTNHIRLIK